jgi:hypothetical protein
MDMQAAATPDTQQKRSTVKKGLFAAHLSMLSGFAILVGYLVISCHHAH